MKNYFACFTFLLFINACLPEAVVASVSLKNITIAAPYQEVDSAKSKKDKPNENTKVIDSVVLRNYVSKKIIDSINVKKAALYPFNSLQQALKASVSGVFVQEPNGEPGTSEQGMLIRGISRPFLTKSDVALAQPAIFINGIPLMQDNTFSDKIQKYDFSPLGSATNLLSTIDLDNVASIHVVKGLDAAAIYGPRAANGAILITTKNAHEGKREISFNSSYGFVAKDMITTTNGVDESNFRKIFYDKFATAQERANVPGFLSDVSNENYYGASNWTDLYYKRAPIYTINGSITGGTSRSNFRFYGANSSSTGNADDTKLDKYVASFFINMLPLKWLTVSSMVNATKLTRDRNRNLRDRFAEMQYVPDLSSPIAPNKMVYSNLLDQYEHRSFDNNSNNVIQGSFSLNAKVKKFDLLSRISFDYNENMRDVFYNSQLLDGNNYVSNYFGYNQRLNVDNVLSYSYTLDRRNNFNFLVGHTFTNDISKYNYGQGYKGPSDYVRINSVVGNSESADYLKSLFLIVNRFTDKQKINLSSLYGKVEYNYHQEFFLNAVLRTDGASNMQPTNRWFFSPVISAQWNLERMIAKYHLPVSRLKVNASWGRLGTLYTSDRYAAGPQYTSDIGWSANPSMSSYNGFGTITRPYSSGWVGYDIPWAYVQETSIGLEVGMLKDRLQAKIDLYAKNNKRMLMDVPTNAEYGYANTTQPGMDVNNKGVELALQAAILAPKNGGITWNLNFNVAYNTNKLNALPGGLNEITVGNQKLVVGKPIDRFWVLQSTGVYQRDIDVPVNPTNYQILNYKGLPLLAGDPKWKDLNGDYIINENDKVELGNFIPRITGNVGTDLTYKGFTLDLNFAFVGKRNILNQAAANRLDFAARAGNNDINSINEITFWQKGLDMANYPVYNPWSAVQAYRTDQDIFIENGAYLKLRSISLGYDITKAGFFKKQKNNFRRLYLYVTALNVFTITPYTGGDPELVNYTGVDTGYGMSIPRTYSLGIKLDL